MATTIGIIGSGAVGQSLTKGFLALGYEVMIGTNSAAKHETLRQATGGKARIGTFPETAAFGSILVLAVKGAAAETAVRAAGPAAMAGKTVLDATNPISDAPPVNGVIQYYTTPNESLMERLQRIAPGAHFVKCFSCIGNSLMFRPDFGGTKPSMFIAGNDDAAKAETKTILDQFGFETEDMGKAEGARAIEPLAMLWCIPGFLQNRWSHAFKLLKR
jgi:8-hydroxy-5-deazaflavin:NADPH oxidoreductase